MSKIRVLIVDDAVVVRRLVANLLSGDPDLEVVGTAANGRIALAKIPQLNPDVVTLDLVMPDMDGLETLSSIRKLHPQLPVVMLSRYTQRGAAPTLDALARGASDYVCMPEAASGAAASFDCLRLQLLPKIKQLAGRAEGTPATSAAEAPAARVRPPSELGFDVCQRVDIVAIGSSTGGPNALAEILPAFPPTWPVPVVIVQHMPPIFTKNLAQRLAAQAAIGVREAAEGQTLEPGQAWLAPGDFHLELAAVGTAVHMRLHQEKPENSCRPSVDVLFRSVAEIYGSRALAVVLTGMGQDGLRGCERIREVGGQVLVQDEASSVVWGMPGYIARAGLAHQVLPLDQLGPELVRRVCRGRSRSLPGFNRAP